MSDRKRVLVTGGAGFIGSHLVERLLSDRHAVTVVDLNTDPVNLAGVMDRITYWDGDCSWNSRLSLLNEERFHWVFHCAGIGSVQKSLNDPIRDFHATVETTLDLLETMAENSLFDTRLIFVSSGAVYGEPVRLPIWDCDCPAPISPYGASRAAAEAYVRAYGASYGLDTTSVRLFSTYGPRQRKQVVYEFIERLFHNPHEITLCGDGEQERDFIYVTDAVEALVTIAKADGVACTYNVASGWTYTINRLLDEICRIMDVDPYVEHDTARLYDPRRWQVECHNLRDLGWEAQVLLREGLERTIEWFMGEVNSDADQ